MNTLKIFAIGVSMMFSVKLMADESASPTEITVYRSASCGCCGKWIEHLQQNRFKVKTVISDDMPMIKEKYAVPEKLASCHTAIVDGYIVEGHVPADDIKNLVNKKPKILGIAAPGMPMGSPGMEMEGQKQDYDVLSYDKAGHFEVFSRHSKQ